MELYSIRASITDSSFDNDDIKKGKDKLDSLINLIINCPVAENNSNFPKLRLGK